MSINDIVNSVQSSSFARFRLNVLDPICPELVRRQDSVPLCKTGSFQHLPLHLVSALNNVDLPTLGNPTIPHLKPKTSYLPRLARN